MGPALLAPPLDTIGQHRASLRAIAEEKFPTGAFALIELDIADWSELPRARGRLIALTRPRDLDPALGPEYAG